MDFDQQVNRAKHEFARKFNLASKGKTFLDSETRVLNDVLRVIGPVKFTSSLMDFLKSNKTEISSTPANSYKKYMNSEILNGVFKNTEQLSVKRESVVEDLKEADRLIDMFKSLEYSDESWVEGRKLIDEEFYELVVQQMNDYLRFNNLKLLLPYLTTDFDYPLLISDNQKPLRPLEILIDIRRKINKLSSKMIVSPNEITVTMCHFGVWENFMPWAMKTQNDIDIYRNEMQSFQGMRRLALIFISRIDSIEEYSTEYKKLLRHLIMNHKCIIGVECGTKIRQGSWLFGLLNQRCITLDSTGENFNG